jgi:hypothetical protein
MPNTETVGTPGAVFPEYEAAGPVERAILDDIAQAEDAAALFAGWTGTDYPAGYWPTTLDEIEA